MSDSQPRHAAPDPRASVKATRTVRFWAVPIVITVAVLSALAAFYLGGILNPMTNLRHFPVAVVNEDAGPTGDQLVNGLVSGLDKNTFDVRVLSRRDAMRQLDTAQVYGAVVIPPGFSSTLQEFARSAVVPGRAERPVISVTTNPRAGTLGSNIAGQTLTRALTVANRQLGERLSGEIALQTQGAPMAGAVTLMLANPIDIKSEVYKALPDGTGNGLSAFYYALLLLLAGFTGSIVVSTLVDSMLGYVPAEFGPVYRLAEQVRISRFRTLLIKWALMALLALLTSVVYMAIASGLGMPIDHSWPLWLYGVFAITAVGVTSTSLIAVLGTLGLLVSMFVFVILGLPSAGATVPLEATPPLFGWLAKFEPMHQVYLGARALLYLDGRADAGLTHALALTAIGLVIGLLLGGIVTRIYDRRGYHRIPAAPGPEKATEATDAPGESSADD
jgi:YhgE/Pip-like protein